MDAAGLVKKYLGEKQVMQLATVKDGQPWVCNLHFVPSEAGILYWVSKTHRRHSQDIENDSKAAAAIAVKGPEHPVIGIQIEGKATVVTDKKEIEKAMKLYDSRYKVSKEFYNAVLDGSASEIFYKITPTLIVLFDEENFPDDPRQEWHPTNAG